ncbi:MAG: 50S ribosomal protein L21 [Kiritimatiellae bacterium]|nr:50S ribosomal protein L21 [Kiritimatiellia bacterium]MDD5522353.1 50S ribosomal protein L21 [Kiritimatiellia bacterium]
MEPYAVVETGSKQYRVKAGDVLNVELLPVEPGKKIDLAPVLAVSDGKDLKVGTPDIKGTKVTATVVKHFRDDKIVAFRTKRRKNYQRKVGHRQELTLLKIEAIKA